MTQLMQEVRKDLNKKPIWMGDSVWAQLKAHWESSSFKKKCETNRRNRESMDGASLHTGGSIKEAKGIDPSLSEFYFRTHRKKDQSWVGPHEKYAYDKFEKRKFELSSQNSTFASGKYEANHSQPSTDHMPSNFDIRVNVVRKKKGRISKLGFVRRTLILSSIQPSKFSTSLGDVDALRSQIQISNESLQRQEQKKLEIRQKLTETRKQVHTLMQHLGFLSVSSFLCFELLFLQI
ncbi:hypothetical protein CR513_28837, partial [Mucuna pruriens]